MGRYPVRLPRAHSVRTRAHVLACSNSKAGEGAGSVEYERNAALKRSALRLRSLLQDWTRAVHRLKDFVAEARDNVKYLYSMEPWLDPMYSLPPSKLVQAIPSCIDALGRMMATATHYRSPQRMTTLLALVSSHLVAVCTAHIDSLVLSQAAARMNEAVTGWARSRDAGFRTDAAGGDSKSTGAELIPEVSSTKRLQHGTLRPVPRDATGLALGAREMGGRSHKLVVNGDTFWSCDAKALVTHCRTCLRLLRAYKLAFRTTKVR